MPRRPSLGMRLGRMFCSPQPNTAPLLLIASCVTQLAGQTSKLGNAGPMVSKGKLTAIKS
jgi:hypothetical protein